MTSTTLRRPTHFPPSPVTADLEPAVTVEVTR